MLQKYLKKMRWSSLQNIISLKILIGQCGKGGWISLSYFLHGLEKNRYGTDALGNLERKNGCVEPEFIKKHDLSIVSMPEDFMDAMFPYENNPYSTTKKEYFSFALIV